MMYNDDSDLLRCPHCGGKANMIITRNDRHKLFFVYALCGICGARSKAYPMSTATPDQMYKACDKALEAWNLRTGSGEEVYSEDETQ